MSFREKSAWASLLSTLVVYIPYFVYVLSPSVREGWTLGDALGAFIGTVTIHVILQIAIHIAIAIQTRQEMKDERDAMIEMRSDRIAYHVVVSACFIVVPCVYGLGLGFFRTYLIENATAEFLCQLFLMCFVAAELTKYTYRAIAYRRGR